jgi:hypothetical protein
MAERWCIALFLDSVAERTQSRRQETTGDERSTGGTIDSRRLRHFGRLDNLAASGWCLG